MALQKKPDSFTSVMESVGATDISNYAYKRKNDILRYAIGIRSIDIFSYKFDTSSEYVSDSIPTENKVMAVSIDSEEVIPQDFLDYAPSTRGDYIKYYISVDEGTSWSRLIPKNAQDVYQDGVIVPKLININSEVAKEQRRNDLAYIDTTVDVYNVMIRVLLSRPKATSFEAYTPLLKNYTVYIETEEA